MPGRDSINRAHAVLLRSAATPRQEGSARAQQVPLRTGDLEAEQDLRLHAPGQEPPAPLRPLLVHAEDVRAAHQAKGHILRPLQHLAVDHRPNLGC